MPILLPHSPRDLAIIVDGSTAMALPYDDDRTYFDQAMEEAKGLADGLRAAGVGASSG